MTKYKRGRGKRGREKNSVPEVKNFLVNFVYKIMFFIYCYTDVPDFDVNPKRNGSIDLSCPKKIEIN